MTSQLDILPARLSTLFVKRMKHVDGIVQLCDVDYAPLAQHMDTDLFDTGADSVHRLPIARLKPILDGAELETSRTASFVREIAEVIQAQSHEFQWLRHHSHII
jgi:hypothetical protein